MAFLTFKNRTSLKHRYLISILLVVIFLFIPLLSHSQSVTEVFKFLQDELPEIEKYPNAIYQDSRGFLWWGGYYKIQQYDGYKLRSYYVHEIFKSEEPISGYPTVDFLEDSEKDFLILFDHALMFYDTIYKDLTRFDFEDITNDSLIHIDYTCLYEDDQHIICIGTSYGTIIRIPVKTLNNYLDGIKQKNNKLLIRKPEYSIIKVDDFNLKDPDKYLYMDILQDKFNNYWVPTTKEVYQISHKSPDEFISVPYILNSYKNNIPPAGTTGAMFLDDHQNIWIARSNSLFMVDFTDEQNFQFREFRFDHFTWWVNYTKGELWMSPGKSIRGYKLNYTGNDPEISKIADYKFHNMDQFGQWHSLKNNYRTKEDLLYIQDWAHGLVMFDLKDQKLFRKLYHIPGDSTTLPNNMISAMIEDHRGNFWLNQFGSELINDFILTDHEFNHFKEVKFEQGPPVVCYFQEDRLHNLWMLSNFVNVFIANLDKFYQSDQKSLNGYILKQQHFEMEHGERVLDINSIVIDKNDVVWISAENGIYYFNPEPLITKNKINYDQIYFKKLVTTGENNPDPALRSGFLLDPVHVEMIRGANQDHVIIIDPDSLKFTILKMDFDGLNDKSVKFWYMTTDHNGDIWGQDLLYNYKITLTKNNKGDYTGARFKRFTAADGFPYQTYLLLCDNNNNIWSTVQGTGLLMYNQSNGDARILKGQQIIRGDAWGGAQYCDKDGYIYLQALDGITIFHPDSIQENILIPEIYITDIKILNKSIFSNPDSSLLDSYRISNTLRLPYSSNSISFEFASLSFTDPMSNRYSYFMEGYDKEPTLVDASYRIATYNKLPPGKYTFKVTGSNNNNIWNTTGTSIHLNILSPWYGTIPAYVIYALIFIGLIALWRINEMRRIRLRQEIQLKQMESDKLRELDHMKSEFFSNISHEFRTPLTLILGPLEEIIHGNFKSNFREEVVNMRRNARRLLRLINQILDLAKIDAGKLKLSAAEQDLAIFIRDSVSNFESAARNKKIELISQIPRKPVMVYFDNEKMEDILENMISNALKFSSAGNKVMVRLKLHNKVDEDYKTNDKQVAEITIRDTGIGIPKDGINRIFDRFYQMDSSYSPKYEGAGIGLSLANELVKLHHGTVRVKSTPGKGTSFIISLPLGRDHLSDEEIISEPALPFPEFKMEEISGKILIHQKEREITSTIDIRNRRLDLPLILLVEDNADMRHFIKNNLDHQFVFIEAADGILGFNTAVKTIPDLIISDIMMPGMDGIEFCCKIRKDDRTSHIPVILLTARADKKSRISGFDTGADDYLTKPFEQEVMISRINNLLKERKILREKFAHHWAETGTTIQANTTGDKFIEMINEKLERNYSNHKFSTQVFTRETGMSRSVFFRKLKAVTDLSPNTYLRNYRLIRASELIRSGEKNISLVAFSTGFNNLSYFSRCFKRMFKKAPHDF